MGLDPGRNCAAPMYWRGVFRAIVLSSLALACLSCSPASSREAPREGAVALQCPRVFALAALADDRHVAVLCGIPVSAILFVDTQERRIAATLPFSAISQEPTGFAASEDGALIWYGRPVVEGPWQEQFGLQKTMFENGRLVTTLLFADAGPELRTVGNPSLPADIHVEPHFGCAIWRESDAIHLFDLQSNRGTQFALEPLENPPSRLFVPESCARNDSSQVVALLWIIRTQVGVDENTRALAGGYVMGDLGSIAEQPPFWIARELGDGGWQTVPLSDMQFLMFINYARSAPPVLPEQAPQADFNALPCGRNAIALVDLGARSARCLAEFERRVRPIGFASDFMFWVNDYMHTLQVRDLAVRRQNPRIRGLGAMSISRSGRLFAWEGEQELRFRKTAHPGAHPDTARLAQPVGPFGEPTPTPKINPQKSTLHPRAPRTLPPSLRWRAVVRCSSRCGAVRSSVMGRKSQEAHGAP